MEKTKDRILTDTSELELSFNMSDLYRKMLQNISEGIFLIRTSDQVIVFVNPALEKMFGYKNHEMVGRNISFVNAQTKNSPEEIAKKISKVLKKEGHWKGEVKNIRKNGSTFWSFANVTTFVDPEFGEVWVSVHTDITDRKKVQEELLQSRKNLQLEIKKRTLSLDKVNEKLKSELLKREHSQEQLNVSLQQYKDLFEYLQKVREEEQIHIARVIHDDISQLLNTLKIELSLLYEKSKSMDCKDTESIDRMIHLTDGCIGSVTSVITELRPVMLEKEGLIPALRKIFSNFQKHTGIACVVLVKEETPMINDEIAITIYRVVQEIMTNVRNHSRANRVNVTITSSAFSFTIVIQDNGKGITPEEMSRPDSFGIIGMKERICRVKGTFTIRGVQGKGTSVKISIPLNR